MLLKPTFLPVPMNKYFEKKKMYLIFYICLSPFYKIYLNVVKQQKVTLHLLARKGGQFPVLFSMTGPQQPSLKEELPPCCHPSRLTPVYVTMQEEQQRNYKGLLVYQMEAELVVKELVVWLVQLSVVLVPRKLISHIEIILKGFNWLRQNLLLWFLNSLAD